MHFILSGECRLIKVGSKKKVTNFSANPAKVASNKASKSNDHGSEKLSGSSSSIEIALLSVGDAIGDYAAVTNALQPYSVIASSINVKTLSIKTGNIGNVTGMHFMNN